MQTTNHMCLNFAKRTVWLLTVFFAFASNARADFQAAAKAYQAKDYEKAYAEFRPLAELGHPESQYVLGVMYFNGQGVGRNAMLAYGWIRLAADAGNVKAKTLEPQLRASIDEENVEHARGILDKFTPAAVQSRLLPKVIENCEYQNATGPKPIDMSAPQYPYDLLNRGQQGYVLFEFFIESDGTVRDVRVIDALPRDVFNATVREAASKWRFEPARRDGRPFGTWAETYMSFKITDGKLSSQSEKQIAEIKRLAESGDSTAQYYYGLILSGHVSYHKPWSEALPWMMKAAQGGSAPAQFRVAQSLLRGRGCEQDATKAAEWLLRSAQQDYADAQVELGVLSLKAGPTFDPVKAIFWLERAAKNGNIKSRKYLAAVLATSPIEKLRDSSRALDLIAPVLEKERGDILAQEIKAAALAVAGKFDQAALTEVDAIKAAKKRKWDVTELNQRLASYQSGKPWYGDLLTF